MPFYFQTGKRTMNNAVKVLVVEDEMLIGAKRSLFFTELEYEVTAILPNVDDATFELAKEAKPYAFFQRIHRSFIVNLSHVEEIEDGSIVAGQKTLPLSRAMREAFLLRIKRV